MRRHWTSPCFDVDVVDESVFVQCRLQLNWVFDLKHFIPYHPSFFQTLTRTTVKEERMDEEKKGDREQEQTEEQEGQDQVQVMDQEQDQEQDQSHLFRERAVEIFVDLPDDTRIRVNAICLADSFNTVRQMLQEYHETVHYTNYRFEVTLIGR